MSKRFFLYLILTGLFLSSSVLALLIGYEIAYSKRSPHNSIEKLRSKAASIINRTETVSEPSKSNSNRSYDVETSLLNIGVDVVSIGIETGVEGINYMPGGGITSFGDEIVLMAGDGRFHVATSAKDIVLNESIGPKRNWLAYLALQNDPAYSEYEIITHRIRYNDLLFIDKGDLAGHLIVSYIEYHPGQACVTNNVAKVLIDKSVTSFKEVHLAEEDWQVVYRTRPCLKFKKRFDAVEGHMSGGKLAYSGSGNSVYLTSGDFHFDGTRAPLPSIAQNDSNEYGKILSIDVIAGTSKTISKGHRNPQGITVTSSGQVIVSEHGPKGGDEINLIFEGKNYGWPLESFGTAYSGASMPEAKTYGRHDTYEKPIFSWMPSSAITNVRHLENFHPNWDGDLLVPTLKSGLLYRLRLEGDRILYAEAIKLDRNRLRYIHQHGEGQLVLWADSFELFFITPRKMTFESELFADYARSAQLSDERMDKVQIAKAKCMECHSFVGHTAVASPALQYVFGAKAGSGKFKSYSEGLKQADFIWDTEKLAQFIHNPQSIVPGSYMPQQNISDEEAKLLVDYLAFLSKKY